MPGATSKLQHRRRRVGQQDLPQLQPPVTSVCLSLVLCRQHLLGNAHVIISVELWSGNTEQLWHAITELDGNLVLPTQAPSYYRKTEGQKGILTWLRLPRQLTHLWDRRQQCPTDSYLLKPDLWRLLRAWICVSWLPWPTERVSLLILFVLPFLHSSLQNEVKWKRNINDKQTTRNRSKGNRGPYCSRQLASYFLPFFFFHK